LKKLGVGGGSEFWGVVRGNLAVLEEAPGWWQVIAGEVTPLSEDSELTQRAAALLPPEPWDDTTWDVWIAAIKAATGRKGRALFHPLRLALTGREDGPELKALLPLFGRAKAEGRLLGRTC
jgi:glutamyl-tRNA synthetase